MVNIQFIFGLMASVTASFIFFPQVLASFKSKKTRDLAWSGIIIGMLNGIFWVVYGLLKGDPFIYVTNSLLFFGAFLLMILKIKYK
jgi:uncharacterized protein with PQ loop repeat